MSTRTLLLVLAALLLTSPAHAELEKGCPANKTLYERVCLSEPWVGFLKCLDKSRATNQSQLKTTAVTENKTSSVGVAGGLNLTFAPVKGGAINANVTVDKLSDKKDRDTEKLHTLFGEAKVTECTAALKLATDSSKPKAGSKPLTSDTSAVSREPSLIPEKVSNFFVFPSKDNRPAGTIRKTKNGTFVIEADGRVAGVPFSGACWEFSKDIAPTSGRVLELRVRAQRAGLYEVKFEKKRAEDGTVVIKQNLSTTFQVIRIPADDHPDLQAGFRRTCIAVSGSDDLDSARYEVEYMRLQ
jgi:hypothetical protein